MPVIHFQSIRRIPGETIAEPLCSMIFNQRDEVTLLKHEVTCPFCLRFLIELKEPSNA